MRSSDHRTPSASLLASAAPLQGVIRAKIFEKTSLLLQNTTLPKAKVHKWKVYLSSSFIWEIPTGFFQLHAPIQEAQRHYRLFSTGETNPITSVCLVQIEPSSRGAHLPPSDGSSIQLRAGWCFPSHFRAKRCHYFGSLPCPAASRAKGLKTRVTPWVSLYF